MYFQCCMVFVLGGLSSLLKHFKGVVVPPSLAPLAIFISGKLPIILELFFMLSHPKIIPV